MERVDAVDLMQVSPLMHKTSTPSTQSTRSTPSTKPRRVAAYLSPCDCEELAYGSSTR
jgi:hypothetical protein